MTAATIRILLADDHPVVREGLIAMLSAEPDFTVLGAAADGIELVEQAQRLHPDVILLDLEMPRMDGLSALEQLRERVPQSKVVVLTVFDTDERILGALNRGARGYLLKGAPRAEICQALRLVHAGGSMLQPIIASKVLAYAAEGANDEALTARETEILRLIAEGNPNKSIARLLDVTERTVKFHVSAILRKLVARNRTEAVRNARKRGLL